MVRSDYQDGEKIYATAFNQLAGEVKDLMGGDDVIGWREENTRAGRRAIAKARSNAGRPASLLVIGDSISQGYLGGPAGSGTGMNYPAAWPWQLKNLLAASGVVIGGTGWVLTGSASQQVPTPGYPPDPRILLSGVWSDPAGSFLTTQVGSTMTFKSDVPGNTVKLAYPSNSGTFSVSINGATPVDVVPKVTAGEVEVYSVVLPETKAHSIKVTAKTGTVTIHGFQISGPSGLQIHNVSCIGMSARVWTLDTTIPRDHAYVTNRLEDLLTPDIVAIMLGVNDLNAKLSTQDTVANLQTIAEKYPDSLVVFLCQSQPTPGTNAVSEVDWASFKVQFRAMAAALNAPLIDMDAHIGGNAKAVQGGYMLDFVHTTAQWHADCAELFASLLTKVF